MDPNLNPNTAPSSAVRDPSFEVVQPSPSSKPPLNRRTILVIGIITLLLVGSGVVAAILTSHAGKTANVTPTSQPGVSSTEKSALGDSSSGGPTLLQVTQVIADTGTFKALQVTADTSVGGNLTVAGNGTFGGSLTASNLAGNGAGVTGVNAALLNGQNGAYYTNVANLQGTLPDSKLSANVALRNSPNTFSATNNFNSGLNASSVDSSSLTVSGSTSLSGTTTISSLLLAAPLAVSNGGTGLTTIPINGVVFGQGTTAVATAVPSGAGQCLISTSTSVQFGSCTGAIGAGVSSLDGISGDIVLSNSSATGTTVTINNATTTGKGIASYNATNFNVSSGVVDTIQDLAVTSTPAFAGITLTAPLAVSSGGTGANTLADNGVVIGQGTGAVTAITSSSAGQCLLSTATTPSFQTCPTPTAPVVSVNGLTGALIIAGASGAGTTITLGNATTSTKGIASFNSTNFSVTSGAVNTAQDINTGATPTFGQLSLQGANSLTVGASATTPGSVKFYDGSTAFGATINTATLTASRSVSLPNETGTICLQNSANCGFLTGASASGSYIGLQSTSPGSAQTGNFNITGVGIAARLQATYIDNNSGSLNINNNSSNNGDVTISTRGGIDLYNVSSGNYATYTSPLGGTVHAAIAVEPYNPSSGDALFVTGLTSSTNPNAVGISINDARGGTHAPSINVTSPNEANYFGLSFDGSNTNPVLKTSVNSLSFVANSLNVLTLQNFGGTAAATLGTAGTTAGQLSFANAANTNGTTINGGTPTATRSITLPDESGVICLENSSNCGFLTGAAANGNYINLQGTSPGAAQTGNFNISGTGIAATIQSANFDTASTGTLTIAGANAITINFAANNSSHTLNIATGTGTQTVAIGSQTSGSGTTISGGSQGIGLDVPSFGTVSIVAGGVTTFNSDTNGRVIFKPRNDDNSAFQVQGTGGNTLFNIDAANQIVSACGTCELAAGLGGLYSSAGLSFDVSNGTSYTTPLGTSLYTKINIPNQDPGSFGQLLALGLPTSASTNARGIAVLDARSAAHQPTIAVLSPNESQSVGFSFDGSNTLALVKTSAPALALQTPAGALLTLNGSGGTALATLGVQNNLNGQLEFANSSNGNLANLQSGTTTSSYTTILPTAIGAAGQCLTVANVASSNQTLGYASCGGGVSLQATSPGTQQTGNLNISGTGIFGTSVATSNLTATGQTILGGVNNQAQLIVRASASQTSANSLISFQNSSGTELARLNVDANGNQFYGLSSGAANTTGLYNTGSGYDSLQNNTTGQTNTATGGNALNANTTANGNTANGYNSLASNTTGSANTATGYNSLFSNTTGATNEALGYDALTVNTTGSNNAAVGTFSLAYNTTGSNNSALGFNAGGLDLNGAYSTLTNLQNATAIGAYAQVQASNAIVLGSVDNATNVGIGTTVPTNTFSVSPLDRQDGTVTRTNGSAVIVGNSATWTSSLVGDQIVFQDGTTNSIAAVTDSTHVTMSSVYSGTTDASPTRYRFHHVGLQVASSGNVGIGTNPTASALTVQGTVSATVLQQSGNAVCDSSSNCTNYLSTSTGVQLQSTTPGTAQTGNLNITGSGIFGTSVVTNSLNVNGQATISGSANQPQLIIKSASGSTNSGSLILLEDSTGNEVSRISSDLFANTSLGAYTNQSLTTGNNNTAIGSAALASNTLGSGNTSTGSYSLQHETNGSGNTADGYRTLENNYTGSYNSALGYNAGGTDSNGHFLTGGALQNATAIGAFAQVQTSNSLVLGSVDTQTNIGIGTTEPTNTLSVSPLDYQAGTAARNSFSTSLVGTGTSWTSAMVGDTIIFSDATTNVVAAVIDATHITMAAAYNNTGDSAPGSYYRFHHVGLQVASSGNVGIGTNPNSNALTVQGTVAATSIQQSGNTVCDSSSNCTNYLTAATGVELQPYTPGTPQVGVLNISGSAYVGNGYVGASQLVVRSTDNLPTHPALLFTDNSGSELARINVDNSYNLGIGGNALVGSFGQFNTAIGALSQGSATGGASDNVSLGSFALYQNSGNLNTAVGNYALYSNGSGTNNAALGAASLNSNVTGSYNSALGFNAGATDKNNYISTGSNLQNATAIGAYAQVQASNSIVLGSVDNQTNVGIGITVPSNQFSVSPLDYQTGTVTRTNGSAVLVGTGTTWTNSMAGDIATFADGTTATIVSVSDSTHATMAVAYGISTGSVGHYRFHRPGFQVTSAGNAYVQNTSTTAFQIQNSLGTSLLSADTSTMTVTVTNVVVSLNLTVNGHIISGGTNPTIVAGTAACTSPTVTVAGTDTAGLITVTTGTGCTVSGKLATLSFATAFGAAPRVTITPGTATAASLSTFIDSSTIATTTFDLDTTVTAASSTTYKWYYHAVQ